jgi:hypothetical protein
VGCSDSKPLCVDSSGSDIGQGFAGAQCIPRPLPCMNNKTGADPDTGCDDYGSEDPICVKDDLTEPASNSPGDQCAPCVNSELSDATTDVGCSDSNPLCVDSNGSSIDPGMAGAQCIKKPDLQFPRNLCENCSKPDALTWLYKPMTGMDLDSAQESKESWVKGSPDDDNTSYVSIVSDKGKIYFKGTVSPGDHIVAAAGSGANKYEPKTYFYVYEDKDAYDRGKSALQTAKYHTSCSLPILIGDQLGSFTLTGFEDNQCNLVN